MPGCTKEPEDTPKGCTQIKTTLGERHVDGVHQEEGYGYSLVFDPPSNVRATPSGQVICSISEMIVISVYAEPKNGWYITEACGGVGWIHESQIRPFY